MDKKYCAKVKGIKIENPKNTEYERVNCLILNHKLSNYQSYQVRTIYSATL